MAMRIEQLYEHHIKPLPAAERRRLVEKIVSDLATQSAVGEPPMRRHWREIHGIVAYPLSGKRRAGVGVTWLRSGHGQSVRV
jgi:hypothetical protein